MATVKHPDQVVLLKLAEGAGSLDAKAHFLSCRVCQRRVETLKDVVAVLRADADELLDEALPESRSMSRSTGRLLQASCEADALAAEIVSAAARGAEALREAFSKPSEDETTWALTLLYACGGAASLASSSPMRALDLTRAVREAAEAVSEHPTDGAPPRALILAEADLLDSQAELYLQRTDVAIAKVKKAREGFAAGGGLPFDAARCDYFEGSAAGYAKDYDRALRLLEGAHKVFGEWEQDHWIGRVEAAMGLVFRLRSNDSRGLIYFESALERLDPILDANAYWGATLNRATLLEHLGRIDEAREGYAACLEAAVKHGIEPLKIAARENLAEILMKDGRFAEAVRAFERLLPATTRGGYGTYATLIRLNIAECHGQLQELGAMKKSLEEVRSMLGAVDSAEAPAFDELFAALDEGFLEVALVSHVRRFLAERREGKDSTYQRFRAA